MMQRVIIRINGSVIYDSQSRDSEGGTFDMREVETYSTTTHYNGKRDLSGIERVIDITDYAIVSSPDMLDELRRPK